jgi:hypothetical protein
MRFRNDTDGDFHMFGVHFASGNTVQIPLGVEADPFKVAALRRNLTELPDFTPADPLLAAAEDGELPYEPPHIDAATSPVEIRDVFRRRQGRPRKVRE